MYKKKSEIQMLHMVFAAGYLLVFATFVLSIPTSTLKNRENVCDTPQCQLAAKDLRDAIDFNADPCDDFYQYVCGNWPKVYEKPTDIYQLRGVFNKIEIINFLKRPNSENEPKAVHKARKLFSLCLDEKTVFKNGIKPIEDILLQVGLPHAPPFGISRKKNFDYIAATIKALKIVGVKQFFDIGVIPNPFNTTVNVIGVSKPISEKNRPPLPVYRKFKNLVSVLVSQEDYSKQALITMCENETTVICWFLRNSIFRRYLSSKLIEYEDERTEIVERVRPAMNSTATETMLSLQELQNITDRIAEDIVPTVQKFNWTRCIELLFSDIENITIDLSNPAKVQIAIYDMDFIEEMITFIYSYSLEKHESGLWWSIVSLLLPYTDSKTWETEENLNREEFCHDVVTSTFGMAVSYYYTTMPQYNKTKLEVRKMVRNIKESFKDLMEQSPWMDKRSKGKSLLKIKSMKSLVVYPSSIKNSQNLDDFYEFIEVSNNFLETIISATQRNIKQQLSSYNRLNDPNEDKWGTTPNIVNAFYDPTQNTIIIPAGLLGIPVYYDSLKALDYGGVGATVGHEIAHGFDNSGRRYNGVGNIDEWWKPETVAAYKKRAKCLIEAYNTYETNFNNVLQKPDSKLTFAENIADIEGIRIALLAYRKYLSQNGAEPLLTKFENYTQEQLFTLGYANTCCENPSEYLTAYSQFNTHSPNAIRVNGVFKNLEEFSEIWKCPKGSNMNPVVEKCSIW